LNFEYVKFEVLLPEDYIFLLRNELNKYRLITVRDYDPFVSYGETKGYWQPLEASNPFQGKKENISYGSKCKVEFRASYKKVEEVKAIIRSTHSYIHHKKCVFIKGLHMVNIGMV
jgi:hypothetical protein